MNNLALFSEMLFEHFHPIFTEKKSFWLSIYRIKRKNTEMQKFIHLKFTSYINRENKSVFLSEWSITHTVEVKFVLIAY